MAAPSSVFTISRVAEMLGEDEEWLHDIALEMEPEDGCLIVWGTGDQSTTVFTRQASNASNNSSKSAKPTNSPRRQQSQADRAAVLTGCVPCWQPTRSAQPWKALGNKTRAGKQNRYSFA